MLKQITASETAALLSKGLDGYHDSLPVEDAVDAIAAGTATAYTTELESGVVTVVKGLDPESLEIHEYFGDMVPVVKELIEKAGGRISCNAYIGMDDYTTRCLATFISLGFTEVDLRGYNGDCHLLLKYVKDHDAGFTDFTAEVLNILYAMGLHSTYAQVRLELLKQLPDIVSRLAMGLKGE